MRRFLTLVCLLGLALPAGISISGCVRNPAGNFCNGQGFGLKLTDVASIILQPQIAGISLAYGQTIQVQAPTAYTCKKDAASIGANQYHYGTTNNQLADISPSGQLCAGTWNRNTGGGIADYTYCYFPNPLPATGGLPYSVAYITATADSVSSNPVAVYIHAPVTSISLATTSLSSTSPQQCFSQNQAVELDAQACYVAPNSSGVPTQYEFCAPPTMSPAQYVCAGGPPPGVTTVPSCGLSIGTLNYAVSNTTIASISPATQTNPYSTITALQPGTTAITATIAQSASSAGYFSTCPPASIKTVLANGSTSGIVPQGVTQNLTTTVLDTQGKPITGLNLTYQSTNPIDISATNAGAITASYPGVASVYAVCEPGSCNPVPINEFGLNGSGLSLSSNPISVIVPGTTSDFAWVGAPGQSQYFSSIELVRGVPGLTTRLPYVPNSMVMDQEGSYIYFGSDRELMIYSTSNNAISRQDTSVPGVVLAASPNASQLLINDQIRGLFYLYNTASGTASTYAGMGAYASWTPDSDTLYVADSTAAGANHTDRLYVYNINTGWSTYDLSSSGGSQNLAITVPGIGAYLAGNPTVAHAWCSSGQVGNNASILFYPQSDSINIPTSVLGATNDGEHILGASLNGNSITLDDFGLKIPANPLCPENTAAQPQTMSPLPSFSTNNGEVNLTGVTDAIGINQIVTGSTPTTVSVTTAEPIAFITYNTPSTATTPAPLPFYLPQASGTGPVSYVTLNHNNVLNPPIQTPVQYASPTAPLAGAFSPDNSIFFVSTAGDNAIHYVSIPTTVTGGTTLQDAQQYLPNLPPCTPVSAGGNDADCQYPTAPAANTYVPATVITVKPRPVT